MNKALKHRLWLILEDSHPIWWIQALFDCALILLILANVAAVAAETMEPFGSEHRVALLAFDVLSVVVFTIEYVVRLWVATENPMLAHRPDWNIRLRYACSPFAIIDLLAILPFYLSLLFPMIDLRVLRVFRLLRLLKLMRYSPALATLARVLVDERRALGAALLIMLGLLMLWAVAMYHAERHAQPEVFGSIPAAMWWALATLTTVGYGDVVPVTEIGRFIGGIVMIFGLAMFALPIGIIASGFSSEIRRRDFVVTWGMVAHVPLFAKLDALSVSRITSLLRARAIQADTVIFRQGDPSDAMFFIASGEVQIDVRPEPVRLKEGDFFGETALLRKEPRVDTAHALTRCRLLVLEESDFHDVMASDGDFRQAITAVAEERLARIDGLSTNGKSNAAQ